MGGFFLKGQAPYLHVVQTKVWGEGEKAWIYSSLHSLHTQIYSN